MAGVNPEPPESALVHHGPGAAVAVPAGMIQCECCGAVCSKRMRVSGA